MSIICEEVFDEISIPSEEEIRDYATKIGIDPDSEPQLLPLAAEGLMKALPPGWKPCYDDKSKSYYYYNNLTKKTQWEHPLDDIYRGLVKKARTESQSFSLQDNREDMTYVTDDILSMDEQPILNIPPKKLDSLPLGARKKDIKLSPLKMSPSASPKRELKLFKQKSEDFAVGTKKLSLGFSSLDEDGSFDKHPRSLDNKTELKVSGGGSMFLKSNTMRKSSDAVLSPPTGKLEALQDSQQPRSILREKNSIEHSKSLEFDKLTTFDKSEKDDDDKKSVRFNLDNNTDIGITFSDKSSSEEEIINSDKNKPEEIINVKVTPSKSRFTVNPVLEPVKVNNSLKVVKPNPKDFIKPKLTLNKSSDSDEDTRSIEKQGIVNPEAFFDTDNSDSSPSEKLTEKSRKLQEKVEKKLEKLKLDIWEEKNEEMSKYKLDLENSHKQELKRILMEEQSNQEEIKKAEIEKLKEEINKNHEQLMKEERNKMEERLSVLKNDLETEFKEEEERMKISIEAKKEELEKYYEEKLVETEKELAERVEKNRDELIFNHNADIEQLKQNHSIIIEELKKEFQAEEQILRKEHQTKMTELKVKFKNEQDQEKGKSVCDERTYEKLRCEKRLLEDKYRCLKEKYLKLKTEVKMLNEKKNRRKEQSTATTNTTGSETEQSNSNNKDRQFFDKPPTPKQNRSSHDGTQKKVEMKNVKQIIIQELDTSISDNCYQSDDKTNQNDKDSSESMNPGRSRKKIFSRLKSSSTSRINNNSKTRKPQRPCSPVENLRRQLQKLEDLEDQFPENPQSDTYHLRYPFSDGQKFEGSSELEFFRHRIHLERDSIKRAKESLRSQKSLFQQRQKELKLKHGTMARHTLQQLCQEEKELTDMEVNLHRTRSLLGEKVIRLRHLEQSLQRANMQNDQKNEDTTLSDISSHSASSGISSTEFATADNYGKIVLNREKLQESSEIIQSLENLNSEIREIWDVLRTQQQQTNIAQVIPPLVYPDLGWPVLAGSTSLPAPPSIPTLADRLHNYRQHVVLANAQSTVVTHANQGATTTLVERTRNLRHWLRQTGIDVGGNESGPPQTTL
ncbi:centrosomal protein 164 isoform X1 [Leptinotarsa decemlineata]|uniref:centrosomal protein 164 isoform X1 n=2 Tax=Leptinotarsa decemlineata TaxID=7539 RepID=UPI003D30A281